MKKFAIIVSLLVISLNGYCDTLDYWHVYYNDDVIAKFNSLSTDLTLQVNGAEIKNTDTISARYGTDHPCGNCSYGLVVFFESQIKSTITEREIYFESLSVSLKMMYEFVKEYQIDKLHFNRFERSNDGLDYKKRYLFSLIFI